MLRQLKQHIHDRAAGLAKGEWFAGAAFSAADIQMSFPLQAATARGGLDAGRPKPWRYLERIRARPVYWRALETGGPSVPSR